MSRTKQNILVAATPIAGELSDAVPLVGYLGAAGSEDHRRLYKDPDLELYVEVRIDDVVDQSDAAEDPAQTMLWVQPDALVAWHESMPVSNFATPEARGPRYPWPRP